MAERYNPAAIELKWQQDWEEQQLFAAPDFGRRKYYCLIEFPYPSGEGLHVGHPRPYTALDILARKRRMEGCDVLFPIGFDAFGLPTENYAIKTGRQPAEITKQNITTFTRQLKTLGFSFDWSRVVNTSDPAYYRWTQWIFLQLYKHGLAYKAKMAINWCPSCKIGLANEEVVNGKCERCGTAVEQREKEQWMLRITRYADRLIEDLRNVDYLERIKTQQINWIGRSEGAEVVFKIQNLNYEIKVFTTRIDTIFSGAFLVLSPEHPLLSTLIQQCDNASEVERYVATAAEKPEMERVAEEKEKTGVELKGVVAINPANQHQIPIWVADFVLSQYGTGAVFADAHDERDFELAKKYGIPLTISIRPPETELFERVEKLEICYPGEGTLVNSEQFDGMTSAVARPHIVAWLQEKGLAEPRVQYKLRDWVFSRQRYWGEPIPMVRCGQCTSQKVLLIHGFEGSGESNWLPWMKKELEREGFTVFAPTMTTADHPDLEQWLAELQPYVDQLGPEDIIVGHSLGSKAALHLLDRSKKKIGHLFLIASAIGEVAQRDWQRFAEEWKGSDVESLRVFWETPIQIAVATRFASKVSAILSEDDPYIDRKTHEGLPDSWQLNLWKGFGHFDAKKIPELLQLVLTAKQGGWVPVPEEQLPIELPAVEKYEPTDSGDSPLAALRDWVKVACPRCGKPAERETDTMPNWAGSNWYFLRYVDPHNQTALADSKKLENWLPVDWYNGGMEHTTLHLLYSRFIYKFLWDIGAVPEHCGSEPYAKRTSHGLILGEGGEKMSKSRGNVVNPDTIVKEHGADTLRMYTMFMGPFDQAVPWDSKGVIGIRRFLDKVWALYQAPRQPADAPAVVTLLHQTIKKVGDDIETQAYNTSISALMIFANAAVEARGITLETAETYVKLLSPFAPHLAEELWHQIGGQGSVCLAQWPEYSEATATPTEAVVIIQVNGKVRGRLTVPAGTAGQRLEQLSRELPNVATYLAGKTVRNIIFVPDRLINFVV